MTAVARTQKTAVSRRDELLTELTAVAPRIETLLPKGYDLARLITGAMVAAAANPELEKCTTKSIALSLARIAQWGLDIGTTAHLVPFGRDCTPIADYKGLIQLILDAGALDVDAKEVREQDKFEYAYGLYPDLKHRPVGDRTDKGSGPIIGAYAVVTLARGVAHFEYMTAEEINEVRAKHSKQWKSGPLTYWYARKTVLRRISKYVRRTPRLMAALAGDETPFDPETGEVLVDQPFAPPLLRGSEKLSTTGDPYGRGEEGRPAAATVAATAGLSPEEQKALDLETDKRIAAEEGR